MNRVALVLNLIFFLKTGLLSAQGFVEKSSEFNINHFASGVFGSGLTLFDWNNDAFDDMVILTKDSLPAFYLNTHSGFERVYFEGIDVQDELKSVVWTDFDNDGKYDLSFTSFRGGVKLFHQTGDFVFEEITLSAGLPNDTISLSYGQAWADFNNDGFIDFFVCNYNFDNYPQSFDALYRNNGDLTFTNVTEAAGIILDDDPTFCAIWSDFDIDGLPDLFVMNDRFVWRNYLYKNNGNGTFSEVGNTVGMNAYMDAMTATAGDYNNDGREDMYITNTPLDGNFLYRSNPNGDFTELAAFFNVQVFGWCWGASWIDYDNDTWQDLFVTSEPFTPFSQPGNHFLLKNNQNSFDLDFSAGFQGSAGATFCVSRGDLNNDGFYDLITNSYAPLNTEVWQNQGIGGNFLRLRLQGTVSNHCAAGAKIVLHAGAQSYHKQIYFGEQFISQNSQWINFGLAEINQVDSVVVSWPSGFKETWRNLSINQNYVFVEGGTLAHALVNASGISEFCPGDSVYLQAAPGFQSYLWSNGDTDSGTYISESDSVSCLVFNGTFYIPSDTLILKRVENPVDTILVVHPFCQGENTGSIQVQLLSNPINSSLTWSTGQQNIWNLQNLQEGAYFAEIQWAPACSSTFSVELIAPDSFQLDSIWLSDPGFLPDCPSGFSSSATVAGGTPPYEFSWKLYDVNSQLLVLEHLGDSMPCIPSDFEYTLECIAIDANNCSDTLSLITPQILKTPNLARDLRIYPQPFERFFTISDLAVFEPVIISLHDVWGRLYFIQSLPDFSAPRDVYPGDLAPGTYTLSIQTNAFVLRKILIHK